VWLNKRNSDVTQYAISGRARRVYFEARTVGIVKEFYSAIGFKYIIERWWILQSKNVFKFHIRMSSVGNKTLHNVRPRMLLCLA